MLIDEFRLREAEYTLVYLLDLRIELPSLSDVQKRRQGDFQFRITDEENQVWKIRYFEEYISRLKMTEQLSQI